MNKSNCFQVIKGHVDLQASLVPTVDQQDRDHQAHSVHVDLQDSLDLKELRVFLERLVLMPG